MQEVQEKVQGGGEMSGIPRTESMWAIAYMSDPWTKPHLYCGTWWTRKEAIAAHCKALGKTWDECHKQGYRAVKVAMTYRYKP